MSDELIPVGGLSNKKRLKETTTTAVVREEIYTYSGASTEVMGHVIADASTAIIGYVKIDQTTPGVSNAVTITSTSGGIAGFDGSGILKVSVWDGASAASLVNASNDAASVNVTGFSIVGRQYLYNPADDDFERQRNNHSVTLLASTSRTSTGTSADQTNFNAKAQLLFIAYDTSTGAGLTPSVQVKDSISGLYGTIWTGTAITSGSTGLYTYLLDPGASTTSTGYTQVAPVRLGRTWRLLVNPSSSGATQYSASVDNLL